MSDVVTFSDVAGVLARGEPLFIRNVSSPPRKMLIVDYPSPEGMRSFSIPRSDVPFNIVDHVDPDSLRQSKSFRTLFNNGLLEVVSEQEAKEELREPGRAAEWRNAYSEANRTTQHRADELRKTQQADAEARAELAASSAQSMKSVIAALDPNVARIMNLVGRDGQLHDPKPVSNLSPRLVSLEDRLKAGSVPKSLVVTELSGMASDLSEADLQHLLKEDSVWAEDVKKWSRDRLKFIQKRKNKEQADLA